MDSVLTWPCVQVERVAVSHPHFLMRLETGLEDGLVDQVVEDQLAQPLRILDHVLQVGHRQVHEGLVGRGEDGPRSG